MDLWIDDHPWLLELLEALEKEEDCIQFITPVLWEEWGLLDYPKIVKWPMDLSTVRENLSKGVFKTIESFLDDVNLVWINCKLYN